MHIFVPIQQKVTVQEGHATYEQPQNVTLLLWKSFYFFNLTNKEAFEAGSRPILEEVGPYSYRCVTIKAGQCHC